MNRWRLSTCFGVAGFLLGWFTRPLAGARGTSLAAHELMAHLRGDLDPLLADVARQTWVHIGLFGLACLMLGYVAGRFSNP
jgi:hypothetical protein